MRWIFLLLPLALFWQKPCYAQAGLRDTSITIVPLNFSYSYQVPNGDMGDRFGANHNLGFSAAVKFKNNYLLGLEGSFIFGNKVTESGMFRQLLTVNSTILNQDGTAADILVFERGYTVMAVVGKLIPVVGPNPNSGLLLKLGGGYMRHKIRIETQNDVVPALEGEYLKGYDRLCAGPMFMAFVGYQHFSNNRFVNFMVGFEMNVGLTKSLRPYNFDSGRPDDNQRFDGLNGLRVGWTLPIYRAKDDREYYH